MSENADGGERSARLRGTSVEELSEQVRDFCEARDWGRFHGPKDLAIGVVTEAAELLDRFRFMSEDQATDQLRSDCGFRESVENELADVLYFVLRFADRFEVDLPTAFARKMAQNEAKYPVGKARGRNLKYDQL